MKFPLNIFRKSADTAGANKVFPKKKYTSFYSRFTTYIFLAGGWFVWTTFHKQYLILKYEPNDHNNYIVKRNRLTTNIYPPSSFMYFGIMQWVYARFLESYPYLREEEYIVYGETLKWVLLHKKLIKKYNLPIIIVITGSQGHDNTFNHILLEAYSEGFRTVSIHPKDFYDSAKLKQIIETIKNKYSNSKIYGIGIEYGANLLVKYAATYPYDLQGVVSIGNPYNLSSSEKYIANRFQWSLLHQDIIAGRMGNNNAQKSVKTLYDVDNALYNLENYQSAIEKIKEINSSINYISYLKTKTLFLQSVEDPFTQTDFSISKFSNPNALFVTTKRGGHNEWVYGISFRRVLPRYSSGHPESSCNIFMLFNNSKVYSLHSLHNKRLMFEVGNSEQRYC